MTHLTRTEVENAAMRRAGRAAARSETASMFGVVCRLRLVFVCSSESSGEQERARRRVGCSWPRPPIRQYLGLSFCCLLVLTESSTD